jgi:hypothetical protein
MPKMGIHSSPKRERDLENILLPFSQVGRRGWGMRAFFKLHIRLSLEFAESF